MASQVSIDKSTQSKTVLAVVCLLVGCLGVHRFMVGKTGTAILMLVTFGGLGIWALIDLVMILLGKFTDKQGRLITA